MKLDEPMNHPPIVFFIHGLNTYGDDLIHTGPLTFGPMWMYWQLALEKSGLEFHSLKEMGHGSLDGQVDRAVRQIERILRGRSVDRPNVHLFGHSLGGLVARGVAKRMQSEHSDLAVVRSVITLGTPHLGSRAADLALELPSIAPRLYKLMKMVGYDVVKRRDSFAPYTIEKINDFNARHPLIDGTPSISMVGSVPYRSMGFPYKVIYRALHTRGSDEKSDGLVISEHQRWGHRIVDFELDHMAQLGFFLYLSPLAKGPAKRELDRARVFVIDTIKSLST